LSNTDKGTVGLIPALELASLTIYNYSENLLYLCNQAGQVVDGADCPPIHSRLHSKQSNQYTPTPFLEGKQVQSTRRY